MKSIELIQRQFVPAGVLIITLLAGCGEGEGDSKEATRMIEEIGVIESSDTRDPNHNYFTYDAYEFEAETLNQVCIEVSAEGFSPLLKLVEVSSGAVIAEWDLEYSTEDALNYTIAGPGIYEVRVYSLEDGSGEYTLRCEITSSI